MGEVAQGHGSKLTPCMEDGDRWFPEGYLGKRIPGEYDPEPDYHSEEAEAARALCAGCWFREECLNIGIETKAEYGIYGGLDPDERIVEVVKRGMQGAGLH